MILGRFRLLLWFGRGLFALGLSLLAWCAVTAGEAAWWQHHQREILHAARRTPPTDSRRQVAGQELARIRVGDAIGELEVPRLGLSAVIVEGDGDASLKVGVGHLPDTPLPWESGNVALAAHRDTYFRPLKNVKSGDVVRVSTRRGTLDYRVRDTLVVNAEDVWVLDATDRPTLTLITCYPFSYVGRAPRRFVVRAERVESATGGDS